MNGNPSGRHRVTGVTPMFFRMLVVFSPIIMTVIMFLVAF